jgi:hypothetical protein
MLSMGPLLSHGATFITILALLPLAAQLFVVVHESGHALVALALGATIRDIELNMIAGNPQVRYTGLGSAEQAVVAASGPALTLLVWLTWLLATRGERSAWHSKLLFVASIGALFPLVMWSVMPVLYANGHRVRDDSVSFVLCCNAAASEHCLNHFRRRTSWTTIAA